MKTICEYLEEDRLKWPDHPYIHIKENGIYRPRTFLEVTDDIQNMAKALLAEGTEKV